MTEQLACTLCGAGGHTAAHCNWNDRRLTFTLESLTEALGNVMCLHELGVELIAANVFRQHPEQAEGAQAGADDLTSPMRKRLLSMGVDEETAESIAAELAICLIPKLMQREAALAQPSPAPAPELERPEVVARVDGSDEDWFIQPGDETELHDEGLLFAGCELVRKVDFDRIVGALRAENAKLSEALDCWPHIRDALKLKLYAAQARVAELELERPEVVAWFTHFPGRRVYAAEPHGFDELGCHLSGDSVGDHWYPLYATPVAQAGQVPSVCDGKEQDAFEAWASGEKMDMSCHPLHWLFLDAKTYSARQGWKAALEYVNAQIAAAPAHGGSADDSSNE